MASRYYYDIKKIETILANREVEEKLGASTLDGIQLTRIDNLNRKIYYNLQTRNGTSFVSVVISWDEGLNPNYEVVAVSDLKDTKSAAYL